MASTPEQVYTVADGLKAIEHHRIEAFHRAFPRGCDLRKKNGKSQEDLGSLASAKSDLGQAIAAAKGANAPAVVNVLPIGDLASLVLNLTALEECDWSEFAEMMGEELAVIGGKTLMGAASTFLPYVSTIVSGKDMVVKWAKCAKDAHLSYRTCRNLKTDMRPGSPEKAAQAVRQLIKRSSTNHARLATTHTAKFAVDVAATAGGFGAGGAVASAATGAAAAAATMANTLFLLGRDYMEMKKANALLAGGRPPNPSELFSACPLLGCYLICGANDSDLVAFMVSDFGKAGWMDAVEKMKKQTLGPLQDFARQQITDSRYELNGFSVNKLSGHGLVQPKVLVPTRKMLQVRGQSAVSRIFGLN